MEGVQEIKINGVWYEFVDGDAVYECRICELENKGAHLLNVCKLCASLSLGMRLIKKKE